MLQWLEIFLDIIQSMTKDLNHFQFFLSFFFCHRSERVEFAEEAHPRDSLESVPMCFDVRHRLTFVGCFKISQRSFGGSGVGFLHVIRLLFALRSFLVNRGET